MAIKSAKVTWIGGKGAEGIDPYVWGGLSFPLDKPVLIDPDAEKDGVKAHFMRHVLSKAATNRFFKVTDAVEEAAEEPEKQPDPFDHDKDGKPGGSKPKAKRGRKAKEAVA